MSLSARNPPRHPRFIHLLTACRLAPKVRAASGLPHPGTHACATWRRNSSSVAEPNFLASPDFRLPEAITHYALFGELISNYQKNGKLPETRAPGKRQKRITVGEMNRFYTPGRPISTVLSAGRLQPLLLCEIRREPFQSHGCKPSARTRCVITNNILGFCAAHVNGSLWRCLSSLDGRYVPASAQSRMGVGLSPFMPAGRWAKQGGCGVTQRSDAITIRRSRVNN